MAIVIWSGAISGDMDVNGNYVGGAKPAANDSVIFDRGSVSVTAWTPVQLANVTVTQGYSGSIGTAGSPLTMTEGITGTLRVGGKQTGFYLSLPTTKTIASVSAETGLVSIAGAGTITTANVSNGASFVTTITALTNLNVVTADSSATVATSGTAITALSTIGRVEVTSRTITAATVGSSGRLVYKGTSTLTAATIETGGVVNKQSSSATDGTMTIKYGATFTNEGNTYMDNGSGTAPTIASAIIWTGGILIPNGVGNTLVVTSTTYIGASRFTQFDPIS